MCIVYSRVLSTMLGDVTGKISFQPSISLIRSLSLSLLFSIAYFDNIRQEFFPVGWARLSPRSMVQDSWTDLDLVSNASSFFMWFGLVWF